MKRLVILLPLLVGCNDPTPTNNLDESIRKNHEAMASLNNTITEVLSTQTYCVVNQEEE
jgi:hypothetical protein